MLTPIKGDIYEALCSVRYPLMQKRPEELTWDGEWFVLPAIDSLDIVANEARRALRSSLC